MAEYVDRVPILVRSLFKEDLLAAVHKTEVCMGAIRKQVEDKELSEEDGYLWIAQTLMEGGKEVQKVIDYYQEYMTTPGEEEGEKPAKKRTK